MDMFIQRSMFSQTAEYALRAVVWLAAHPDAPLTSQEIARATRVPPDYLSKVMQALGRAELVDAQRGKHGGFVLARPAARISILDVLNAVDPIPRIRKCPLDLKSHRGQLCPLHRRVDAALDQIERVFAATLISEVLEDESPVKSLCNIAEVVHA
jgi:Rrf2 family protein